MPTRSSPLVPLVVEAPSNSHLAGFLLTDAAYIACMNIAFDIPVHPGNTPNHAAQTTAGVQIAKTTIDLFNKKLMIIAFSNASKQS